MDSRWFERTVSAFPLSIGTSLALESIFKGVQPPYDPDREIPKRIKMSNYEVFYINLETILRNIFGAIDKDLLKVAKPEQAVQILKSEIDIIQDLLRSEGRDTTKGIFYYYPFEKILSLKNNQFIYLRIPSTDNQKHVESLYNETLSIFLKEDMDDKYVRKFTTDIKPQSRPSGLMLSHIPYDLTNYRNFSKLDLLESHTGKLKNRSLFYTKYFPFGIEDMSVLPMNRRLLYIFGDKVSFSPWSIKLRKTIFDIAKKGQWNYMTTDEKITIDIHAYSKDYFLVDTISKFPV